MKGFNQKILRVDLCQGKCSVEKPSESFYRQYLGGRGLIVPYLLKEMAARSDPLGPDNRLIFAVGPLTGYIPGGARNSVGAKSPLTGGFGEAEAGGFWGAELKMAGFDAIVIHGKAKHPVYLNIEKGQASIEDGAGIWGLEIADAQEEIKERIGAKRTRVTAIGPGGEALIPYASIANDVRHTYGRTGMGAVMGSKNLKAIAVRGSRLPEVAQRKKLVQLSRWMKNNYKKAPFWKCGTGAAMDKYEQNGNLPINNFQGGWFRGVKKITAQMLCDLGYLADMHSCFICPMHCKKVLRTIGSEDLDPRYSGPEYEALAAFGNNCGVDDLAVILKANELCNRYGIDVISTGVSISFAMECFENGILNLEDTGGIDLRFGNASTVLEVIPLIARRQGFGALLARGTKRAAEILGQGSDAYAMQVKGLELPMHDPRRNMGMGLHYAVHFTGADHCTGVFDDVDSANLVRFQVDKETAIPVTPPNDMSPDKARFLKEVGFYRQLCNYAGLCQFLPWSIVQVLEAMEAITGWKASIHDIADAVDRGLALTRIFNFREGITAQNDTLPKRFHAPALEGPLQKIFIDLGELDIARKEYYRLSGWDQNGLPTRQRLEQLDLVWALKALQESGLA